MALSASCIERALRLTRLDWKASRLRTRAREVALPSSSTTATGISCGSPPAIM
jgi:hypothetical protein